MKSEHRHELRTNDLAKSLLTFQDYVKVYGGRVFLGLAIVILIIVLIIQRSGKSRDAVLQMQDDLAYVNGLIDRLSQVQVGGDGRVSMRPAEADPVRNMLQQIRDKASDKKLLAEALLAQGDYCWALATYPELPAAATQPSLRPEKPRPELLKDAKEAYQQVISQYADQPLAALRAHFSLAAVAENESNWDEAKRQLEAVKSMPDAGTANLAQAEDKLKKLEELRRPLLVGEVPDKEPPKPAATFPSLISPDTTKPATTGIAAPATRTAADAPTPATHVAAPTTKPSPTTKPAR